MDARDRQLLLNLFEDIQENPAIKLLDICGKIQKMNAFVKL